MTGLAETLRVVTVAAVFIGNHSEPREVRRTLCCFRTLVQTFLGRAVPVACSLHSACHTLYPASLYISVQAVL